MIDRVCICILTFLICFVIIMTIKYYEEYKVLKFKYDNLKEYEKYLQDNIRNLEVNLTKTHCEKRELNKLIDDLKNTFNSDDIKLKILELKSLGTMSNELWYKPKFFKFKDISEIHEGKIYYPSKRFFHQKNNNAIVIGDSWDSMYFPVKDL